MPADMPARNDATALLFSEFMNPPAAARPRVWWHWMDGNVNEPGIVADLEWLKSVGVGGVQAFTGAMGTPAYTSERVTFRSPEWRSAMSCAAATAGRLGLELSVATSAGWSATGGPWVRPEAGMKKLVCTATRVSAASGPVVLAAPPSNSGPYQDVPFAAVRQAPVDVPDHFEDVAVLAFPAGPGHFPLEPSQMSSSTTPDGAEAPEAHRSLDSLGDGRFWPAAELPLSPGFALPQAWILAEFPEPAAVGSVRVGLPSRRGFGTAPAPLARLESSDDGVAFTLVVDLPASSSPVRSAAFSPVTARYFRLVLEQPTPAGIPVAAGIKPLVLTGAGTDSPSVAVSALQLFAGQRVNRAEEKAGYAPVPDFYALDPSVHDPSAPGAGAAVGLPDVVDLTARMHADGTLDWAPEQGEWTVLRLGFSLTGHVNAPAPADATGLEVDKLDAGLVQEYLETYLGFFEDAVGSGLEGITSLLSDSIESGPQNWTPLMAEEFRARRGYDLLPWLPALTGIMVESAERSDAFLWDYRRTIAELLAESHYGTLARLARERGLGYYAEALEDHRPQLGDDLEMRSHADVPMGAMWCYPPEEGPRQTYVADVQGAASVSHVYGKAATGAESMSAFGRPFQFTPRMLKPVVDMEFALGVNLLNIHTSPHQPDGVPKPGITLSPYLGQSFTRNDSWAHAARPWIDYLARCSHLLQQGNHVADVAYFYGEEAPVTGVFGDASPGVPPGHGFDFINLDGLLNHVTVTDDGGLLTTGGVRYRLLYLGGTSHRMTLAAVRRVTELLDAGATVAGWRPGSTPSAADDSRLWAESVEALWKPGRAGLVDLAGVPAADGLSSALELVGLAPDWSLEAAEGAVLPVIHRRLDRGELYFISNQLDRPESVTATFRTDYGSAEIWDAVRATRTALAARRGPGGTAVELELPPFGSAFVLLRKDAGEAAIPGSSALTGFSAASVQQELAGPWTLSFSGDGQSPMPLTMDRPGLWSGPGAARFPADVKYFSGTGTYSTEFDVEDSLLITCGQLFLDLGDVRDLAEVTLNGQQLGTVWTAPFRIDVAGALRPGANQLEIAVTNAWANRLAGDAAEGRTDRPGSQIFEPGAPLLPAGLVGPVRLVG